MDSNDLKNRFTYHSPAPGMPEKFATMRATLLDAAEVINENAPDGREKATAITKLEEAMFWANAALARTAPPAPPLVVAPDGGPTGL